MFKLNNKNTRTRCELCSKLTIKTPKRRHFPYTKAHISPGEKFEFLDLGKAKCSRSLCITYYRKSDNSKFSFKQFSGLQKCRLPEKT